MALAGIKRFMMILMMFPLFCQTAGDPAMTSSPEEYEVKAAFIYNIAKFTDWPNDSLGLSQDSQIVVGVLGEDPFGSSLDKVLGDKMVRGRTIRIERFKSVGDIQSCQILFISRSEASSISDILSSLGPNAVLTVGDFEEFNRRGGMIRLYVEQNRVRLAINIRAVTHADLKISSRLLNLATIVDVDPLQFNQD